MDDAVSGSGRSIRGCSVCRPSPAYVDRFYCSPIGLVSRPAQIYILAQIGGKTFGLHVPPALAPYAVYGRETLADGGSLLDLTNSIVDSCGGRFAVFNKKHTTLKDYLTRWHTCVLLSNRRFAIDEIVRIEEEGTRGIKYDDPDLLWYDWRTIEVLKKETDSHFQVQLDGHRYGCYAPNDLLKLPDYASFRQEVRVWKKVTQSPKRPGAIPRLFGLVCTPEKPGMVLAALYEWIEADGSQTLKQVDIGIVSLRQRERWYWQIFHAISFLHENGASWTIRECGTDPITRVAIGTNGNAFLKHIHFGELENNRFVPNYHLDWTALRKVRLFLRLGPEPARARVAKRQPFRFMGLPFDVRHMIYELLLAYPGNITWDGKYRHRMDTPYARSEKLTASGLFHTSRQVRSESLSYLLEHNVMQIDAPYLSAFLSSPLECKPNSTPEMVGRSLRRIVFTLSTTTKNDPETWQKQCEGVLELKKYCSSLKFVQMIPFHQELWSQGNTAEDPLTSLPSYILTEESEYDDFIHNFSKVRVELAEG